MDRQQHPHAAARNEDEARREGPTDNPRRISTSTEDRRNLPTTTTMSTAGGEATDDSYSFPAATQSLSWESHSDNEGDYMAGGGNGSGFSTARGLGRREQRKFDATTPTLIDEVDEVGYDEEEEMVSLQRARMRQQQGFDSAAHHRRTPGASMYKSGLPAQSPPIHRRTPGPLDMPPRPATAVEQTQQDDSALLGFGLTLTTPVADNRARSASAAAAISKAATHHHWDTTQSSSATTTPQRASSRATSSPTAAATTADASQQQQQQQQPSRPPRAPGNTAARPQEQRGGFTFAPWPENKQPPSSATGQLESTAAHRSFSPNTMRLTEDLGNLLFEEEDSADRSSQQHRLASQQQNVFRGDNTQGESASSSTSTTDWTAAYVFSSDSIGNVPSRVPRSSMGRGRRGKNDNLRRQSRGQERSTRLGAAAAEAGQQQQLHHQIAAFLPYAQQPKPVRSMQPGAAPMPMGSNPFFSGSFDSSDQASMGSAYAPPGTSDQSAPRFFFGGAFAPPLKDGPTNFRPPPGVPPPTMQQQHQQQQQPSQFTSEQQHASSGGGVGGGLFMPTSGPMQHQPGRSVMFGGDGGDGGAQMGFHSQSFQPLPRAASRDSPYHQFPSPNPGYGNTVVSPSPSFGFPPASPYPPYPPHPGHPPHMQHGAHEYYHPAAPPPQIHPHQERPPSLPQFTPSPQDWSGGIHYGTAGGTPVNQATGWFEPTGGWIGGEFQYQPPPPHAPPPPQQHQVDNRVRMSPQVPAQQPSSWPPPGMSTQQNAAGNMFGAPPPQVQAQEQPAPPPSPPMFAAAMPALPPPTRRDQPQKQKRDSGARKGQGRKGSKQQQQQQPKSEKGKKSTESPASLTSKKTSKENTKKKKQTKGKETPTTERPGSTRPGSTSVCSTPSNVLTPADEGAMSAPEDPAEAKRLELIESPATRSSFKDFYRKFRAEERTSFQGAEGYAIQSLGDGSLPDKVHWRVYLELADLAKRSNRFNDARCLYQQVCQLQPYASQGWLEYSKLEEECGNMNRGARILHAGLEYCEYSENLLTRAIKHEEKMGNLTRARELLARLKHVGIEKVWRTVLEGALLEARAGNEQMARRVLKYLMHHVPWYGPLYLEAYRLERDQNRVSEALAVVERGLSSIPRYGPLWFGAFRLCEEMDLHDGDYALPRTMAMVDRATESISKELIWKVHLDAAQMLERAALDPPPLSDELGKEWGEPSGVSLEPCRQRFAMTVLNCPPNLRWKVWLAAGRMEIGAGNYETARSLFRRAHQVVPEKGRSTTLLECARLEEFSGDTELASAILCKCRVEYGSDWKVWLENVLLEIRRGDIPRATVLAKGALEIHPGTGRLWAALVQLRYVEGGEEAQFDSLRRALNAVPKSGEVWCEGGRIHLNPLSHTFDLDRARRHLFFATRFTPQYGDSFLETLRLELLEQWFLPISGLVWDATKSRFLAFDGSSADISVQLTKYIFDITPEIFAACTSKEESSEVVVQEGRTKVLDQETSTAITKQLEPDYRKKTIDLTLVEQRCANADPNYGLLWFYCRFGPTDTARRILSRATESVIAEIRKFAHIYILAMIRRTALMAAIVAENEQSKSEQPGAVNTAERENSIDAKLLAAPSLRTIWNGEKKLEEGLVLLERTTTGSIFATGLTELNKHQPIGGMSLRERRRALFGTDALFSSS